MAKKYTVPDWLISDLPIGCHIVQNRYLIG